MSQDPIQPLADIGRRVLRTVRYLTTSPDPAKHLESYESQLRDPVVALSDSCGELLERLAAEPVAAEPGNLPHKPASRFVPAPNSNSTSYAISRADAASIPAEGRDEVADPRGAMLVTKRLDAPDHGGGSRLEEIRRTIDAPIPFPEDAGAGEPREANAARATGRGLPQPGNPTAPFRPAVDERSPGERPPTGKHEVGPDRELYPEERGGEMWPPASQIELLSDTRAPDEPARAEGDPARGVGKSDNPFPLHVSRLTGSTERLAAMLRAQVEQPETVTTTVGQKSQESENTASSRQGDVERGASRIIDGQAQRRPDGRASVEEIMERLAYELETEFARTYGRSGG